MSAGAALELSLRRDRTFVLAGLIAISTLSWAYLFYDERHMGCMAAMSAAAPRLQPWAASDGVLMFAMWAIMMVAMMVPSVSPMVLTFAMVNRKRREQERPFVPTAVFLLGYLAVWTVFSALATAAQWKLHAAALLSPAMVVTSPLLGAGLLLAAGLFQLTPLKRACLVHCRTPLSFLMAEWREGKWGAFVMGLRHGGYCVGCCWFLMALLFVAGVMNLLWVALLSGLVLAEKIVPRGRALSLAAGVALTALGLLRLSGLV
ncbi:MAG: DUF2182 domain-containing protein [Candidatus Omnitrophica bacterium]|nr:DUF2182 domain-containing protein [Candidatus Omnitrophota bacterium]